MLLTLCNTQGTLSFPQWKTARAFYSPRTLCLYSTKPTPSLTCYKWSKGRPFSRQTYKRLVTPITVSGTTICSRLRRTTPRTLFLYQNSKQGLLTLKTEPSSSRRRRLQLTRMTQLYQNQNNSRQGIEGSIEIKRAREEMGRIMGMTGSERGSKLEEKSFLIMRTISISLRILMLCPVLSRRTLSCRQLFELI